MYFPIGWPKLVNLALPGESASEINHICCDALKIIVAAISNNFLGLWYANPLIPITFYKRSAEKVLEQGHNKLIVWKPDSRQIAVLTNAGILLLYQVDFEAPESSVLTQIDSPAASLRRDSAELFIKENIPRLSLQEISCINVGSSITTICCISLTELLIANNKCELLRLLWSELDVHTNSNVNKGNNGNAAVASEASGIVINLRRIPFYLNQNSHLKNLPAIADAAYIAALEYSPFIGGCAAVFSDRRAAFLIAMHLRFDEQNMHGFWVPDVEDATVCNVNHKFRLLAYGRMNSDINVYAIEDTTGGLELSHRLSINSNVMPGSLGKVCELKWSPDGCVLAATWENGGIALWSTFGALLMSTLNWDFGLHVDLLQHNPLQIRRLEWSTEGYQLLMITRPKIEHKNNNNNNNNNNDSQISNTMVLNFVKSTLTMNPCMTSHPYVLLQGDDTLYLNQGDNLEKIYCGTKCSFPNNQTADKTTAKMTLDEANEDNLEVKNTLDISSILSESKYWTVLQLPQTYAATNWPIRYSAINAAGTHIAVAGRTGLAHYSLLTRKWKLFGNESQEKDFVVSGGLLWWQGFIVMGCYSLIDRTDEIRCYPEECKLDNQFGNKFQVRAPVISLNMHQNQLIALTADGIISLFALNNLAGYEINVDCVYEVDVKNICIHPACIVSLNVCNLRNDLMHTSNKLTNNETIIVNVCGRILMIQRDSRNSVVNALMATCLASCVECFWLSNSQQSSPMSDCLWLYSGVHGMRMWLPILPPNHEQRLDSTERLHTFMSKRIMLTFPLKLYPLVILFDNVIVLGVENETTLYANEAGAHFSLPFCLLERKSQVYLHRILRQLIKRNLGYSAWEIAKSCRSLPYFPHALELLLHEVLEEEATSKEPIPDALLPSILDFIREFPVYLQTIVQCARKTEIALWPYLFSMAGKPKDLFQQCLLSEELETAASYLIILQNLEPSLISKQYATLLLDIALQNRKWELAKDLIRFLKAIDPNEIDSPRSSMVVNLKIAPHAQAQVNQNPEVFNLILGTIARERSFSNTNAAVPAVKDKKEHKLETSSSSQMSIPDNQSSGAIVLRRKTERKQERREIFCIDTVLQRHARQLLQQYKLIDLGYMCASLDFQLVSWLLLESERAAKLDDFIIALTALHAELQLPAPCAEQLLDEDDAELTLDYAQLQRQFLETRATQLHQASSHTSESGYFSLAVLDTPTSMQNKQEQQQQQQQTDVNKSRSNSTMSIDHKQTWRPRRLCSLQHELQLDCTPEFDSLAPKVPNLPAKLAIQIRYLLQLFIEAKCTDYALILSILLQDAAAIGRIINVIIRSESLSTCTRMENALKRLTLWSFDRECLYRSFMISLQPYIYLLEQYVASNDKSSPGSLIAVGNSASSVHNGSVLSLSGVGTVGKLAEAESCERLMDKNHHLHHHHHNDMHLANGKVTWPLEAQRQTSLDASLLNMEMAKVAHLSNGRRASTGENERKRHSATGCSIM